MPDDPIRLRILEAIRERLRAIHGSSFHTNVGVSVTLGEDPRFGPDDPQHAIAIKVGEDELGNQQRHVEITRLPIEIWAVVPADLVEPQRSLERILADIKMAIELEDRTLGGLCRDELERDTTLPLEREEGQSFVGVRVTYTVPYSEAWGQPHEL